MTDKYLPLENYLRDLPQSQKEATLLFTQIETIINTTLPASAYKYQAWWANEKEPHQPEKLAYMNAGWRVDTVNLQEKWVRFIRK